MGPLALDVDRLGLGAADPQRHQHRQPDRGRIVLVETLDAAEAGVRPPAVTVIGPVAGGIAVESMGVRGPLLASAVYPVSAAD